MFILKKAGMETSMSQSQTEIALFAENDSGSLHLFNWSGLNMALDGRWLIGNVIQ